MKREGGSAEQGSGGTGAGGEMTAGKRRLVEADLLLGVGFQPKAPVTVELKVGASSDKEVRLAGLRDRHERECPHCTTATGHTRTVFGEGNANAAVMFVGEAPGADEDRLGRPFVGRAGQLLNRMITAMGLKREDVYIANVLKARPPENATPTPLEAERCGPYLYEQIRIIGPQVIVAMGSPATKFLLQTSEGITRIRGQWYEVRIGDGVDAMTIAVMPTFHPAYLLRNYTADARGKVWSDLQEVMKRVGLPITSGAAAPR